MNSGILTYKDYQNIQDESKSGDCPNFPHFGASYPDATCIDGSLHDLDDSDEPGMINLKDEDFPCPFCRPADYIRHHHDPLNGTTKQVLLNHLDFIYKKYKK